MAHRKQIEYKGHSVVCGTIYQLKEVKGFSDYAIATLLNVSESTVWRRRKKHMANGDFYEGSTTIF
ncbi:MAG: helix-turn-helix domain-containing protein [Lachnospiraceae bacterium]|nr:helix-turn-helix domain-containing protein [Lachnospiraceae bacterium]